MKLRRLCASTLALACLLAPIGALAQTTGATSASLAPVPPAVESPASATEAPLPPAPPASDPPAVLQQASSVTPAPAPAPSPPIAAPSVATPQPSRERPDAATEEGGIWGVADRAERDARTSGASNRDPALNAYVRGIACKVAAEYCGDIRLYLMDRPFFNAQMAPNGYTEVWSGLMLRAEDEAQLAFVLGHEITHYSERHSLDALRALRARANGAMAVGILLAVAGAAAAANSPNSAQSISNVTQGLINIAYLGALASFLGFTRENETEADDLGYDRAVAAGYAPRAGAALWTNLISETEKSQFPRVRERATRASLFATHPVTTERVAALRTKATTTSDGATDAARYRAAIRPHLGPWLRDDLRRRDWEQTLYIIDRKAESGEDLGVLEFYRGETYRLRRGAADPPLARAAYERAVTHADAPAAAWRALGEIHAREGRNAEARTAFTTYLERAPNAEDRLLIERRIAAMP